MADPNNNDQTLWYTVPARAILPVSKLHIPRKLRPLALGRPFEIRVNTAFDDVIAGCTENRPGQWINREIQSIFSHMHRAGHAHSIECWANDQLVGGIYGMALGGAFCAESMFSRVSGASKIALIHLCARLHKGGFVLLDCQIINDHTRQFGAYEIPAKEYLHQLSHAMNIRASFELAPGFCEYDLVKDYIEKSDIC